MDTGTQKVSGSFIMGQRRLWRKPNIEGLLVKRKDSLGLHFPREGRGDGFINAVIFGF